MMNFEIRDLALKEAIKKDPPMAPTQKKKGTVTKWAPPFDVAVSQHYGTHKASIDYLLCEDAVVPAASPPLALAYLTLLMGVSFRLM